MQSMMWKHVFSLFVLCGEEAFSIIGLGFLNLTPPLQVPIPKNPHIAFPPTGRQWLASDEDVVMGTNQICCRRNLLLQMSVLISCPVVSKSDAFMKFGRCFLIRGPVFTQVKSLLLVYVFPSWAVVLQLTGLVMLHETYLLRKASAFILLESLLIFLVNILVAFRASMSSFGQLRPFNQAQILPNCINYCLK